MSKIRIRFTNKTPCPTGNAKKVSFAVGAVAGIVTVGIVTGLAVLSRR